MQGQSILSWFCALITVPLTYPAATNDGRIHTFTHSVNLYHQCFVPWLALNALYSWCVCGHSFKSSFISKHHLQYHTVSYQPHPLPRFLKPRLLMLEYVLNKDTSSALAHYFGLPQRTCIRPSSTFEKLGVSASAHCHYSGRFHIDGSQGDASASTLPVDNSTKFAPPDGLLRFRLMIVQVDLSFMQKHLLLWVISLMQHPSNQSRLLNIAIYKSGCHSIKHWQTERQFTQHAMNLPMALPTELSSFYKRK